MYILTQYTGNKKITTLPAVHCCILQQAVTVSTEQRWNDDWQWETKGTWRQTCSIASCHLQNKIPAYIQLGTEYYLLMCKDVRTTLAALYCTDITNYMYIKQLFVQALKCPGCSSKAKFLQWAFLHKHIFSSSLWKRSPQVTSCLCSDLNPVLKVWPDKTASKKQDKAEHKFWHGNGHTDV